MTGKLRGQHAARCSRCSNPAIHLEKLYLLYPHPCAFVNIVFSFFFIVKIVFSLHFYVVVLSARVLRQEGSDFTLI